MFKILNNWHLSISRMFGLTFCDLEMIGKVSPKKDQHSVVAGDRVYDRNSTIVFIGGRRKEQTG